MTDALDAAELPDVDVDQFAYTLALVSACWHARLEGGEAAETTTAQHGADGQQRPAELARDG